jgi:hypothetical protein
MNTIEAMREFFGWCSVINISVLFLSSVLVIAIRGTALRIHGKMFNLDEQSLSKAYLQYLAQYKIATMVFSIVPYFALRLMG